MKALDNLAKQAILLMTNQGCRCHQCNRLYTVDLVLPDALWRQIAKDGEMLCGSCAMQRVENVSSFAAFKLVNLCVAEKTFARSAARVEE